MRQLPKSPALRRSTETLPPKVEIVIACEGKNTEPSYFQACVDFYGAGLVRFRVIPRHGVPMTVVRTAIEEREKLLASARKLRGNGNTLGHCFRVWAVFDKDDFDVDEALALAVENRIDVAFSNPCFEVWPILHYFSYGSQDGRHAIQRRLKALMPSYDHEGGAIIDFDAIRESFPAAYERAALLNAARIEEQCPGGCPSTTVGELVQKIVENGKINFRSPATQA